MSARDLVSMPSFCSASRPVERSVRDVQDTLSSRHTLYTDSREGIDEPNGVSATGETPRAMFTKAHQPPRVLNASFEISSTPARKNLSHPVQFSVGPHGLEEL